MKKMLETLCGLLAGIALFAIMVLTFLDVGGRKLLDNSITGSLELTELLMVVVIFGALPLVSERGEHVVFDSLDPYLPDAVKKIQRALVHLLCGAALLGLGNIGRYAANMGAQLLTLKFSREDESEADLVGLELAARAGYNPEAGVSLWQKMLEANKSAPPQFMSTHPAGATRIADIERTCRMMMSKVAASMMGKIGSMATVALPASSMEPASTMR